MEREQNTEGLLDNENNDRSYNKHAEGSSTDGTNGKLPSRDLDLLEEDSDVPSWRTGSSRVYEKQKLTIHVWLLSFFAAIDGFAYGYNTGVVSGAMLPLRDKFSLSSFQQELIVSVIIGGGFVASLVGGMLSDWLGRRIMMLMTSAIFIVGALVTGLADDVIMLMVGRFIVGIGIGFTVLTVPVYIAESSPVHYRGRLVTGYTLFVTGGQWVACLVNGGFSYLERDGWRYMFGLAAVPPLLQFAGVMFLPESPRWLMRQGRPLQARRVLEKLRGTTNVNQEIEEIRDAMTMQKKNTDKKSGLTILRMLVLPYTRRALLIGCALQLFQQLGGINVVMYYSASIVKMSGVTDQHDAIWLAALIATSNFLYTIVGIWLVERSGRKKLVLGSLAGAVPSLAICAVAFQLASVYTPLIPQANLNPNVSCGGYTSCGSCVEDIHCGFCYTGSIGNISGMCLSTDAESSTHSQLGACANTSHPAGLSWAYNYCPTHFSWMAIAGMIVYLMFFASGMGSMPWTINSEIYPLWARSTGNAFASTAHWLSNFLVSMTFLTLTEVLTPHGTFWLLVGICFVGFVFFALFLPETRGKKLEEVETLFEKPWCSLGNTTPPAHDPNGDVTNNKVTDFSLTVRPPEERLKLQSNGNHHLDQDSISSL